MIVVKVFGEFTVKQPKWAGEGLRVFHNSKCYGRPRPVPEGNIFGYRPYCGSCKKQFPSDLNRWLKKYLNLYRVSERMK
jgi:endogenous inhibitor of DNA gyrase (YacG/DUF329 family)